jgi:hypothetical protein
VGRGGVAGVSHRFHLPVCVRVGVQKRGEKLLDY